MLVFSAFTPHTPLLIPNIGKENIKKISETISAMEQLEKELAEIKPDTIIIISGHHSFLTDHFIINMNPEFKGDFQEFSDLTTELTHTADITTINEIRDFVEDQVPLTLKSEENMEYGKLAPLYYLTRNIPETKIVPLSYSTANKEAHFKLGKLLKEVIQDSSKRIAVIAAGDLSHKLSKDAPGGFSEKAKKYDELVINTLKEKNIEKFLNISEELIEEASECSYYSLLILLGIINKMNYEPEILSYEHPFGVGYLTVNFKL